ncbi:MAG: DUF6228 family protein [Arenimonas sp.]
MQSIDIKSCDDATTLTFTLLSSDSEQIAFSAQISGAPFVGQVDSSTYFCGPPTLLFQEMARDWRGWSGTKEWRALDGELSIVASSDSLGHVTLITEMSYQSRNFTLSAKLILEAGQLDQVLRAVNSIMPLDGC